MPEQKKEMVAISKNLHAVLLNYLGGRPYNEVRSMVVSLENSPKLNVEVEEELPKKNPKKEKDESS